MSFEKKSATVRFDYNKATLEQIVGRYDVTPFTVKPKSSVALIFRDSGFSMRTWTEKPKSNSTGNNSQNTKVALLLELAIATGQRFTKSPKVSLPTSLPAGFKLIEKFQPINQAGKKPPNKTDVRRFAAELEHAQVKTPLRQLLPISYSVSFTKEGAAAGTMDALIRLQPPPKVASNDGGKTGVALIGGTLDLRLGHLCDQKGCVEHFYQSMNDIPGLAGVRPYASLREPRAIAFLRAKQAVDVWSMRETLRDRGVEITGITPQDMRSFLLRVDLVRWKFDKTNEVYQCAGCRERVTDDIKKLNWVQDVQAAGGGLTIQTKKMTADLVQLFDTITNNGMAPAGVWLVPAGAAMPKPPPPRVAKLDAVPMTDLTNGYASVRLDLGHPGAPSEVFGRLFSNQKWANLSRLNDEGNGLSSWLTPRARTFGPLTPLLNDLRSAGHTPKQMRLAGFGDVRITVDFVHLCGEVEYSKPPKRKKSSKKSGKSSKDKKKKEKKFVPRPLRPGKSSNARQAIEAAVNRTGFVKDGIFRQYHVKPMFKGPRKLYLTLAAKGEDVVRIDELIGELRRAGFPPKSVTVSRLFPGISFGSPIPPDLNLLDAKGKRHSLSSFRSPIRPFAIAFVSFKSPRSKYKKYKPDPKHYEQLKKTIEKYKNKVDFIVIGANKKDKFSDTVKFLKTTGLTVPVLHDDTDKVRAAFNVQFAPPPHMFLFDADGLLRYAGEPHDSWEKPEKRKDIVLERALELVFQKKYKVNGAVFYNQPKCNCSAPHCGCPRCGCGPTCRCGIKHCGTGF